MARPHPWPRPHLAQLAHEAVATGRRSCRGQPGTRPEGRAACTRGGCRRSAIVWTEGRQSAEDDQTVRPSARRRAEPSCRRERVGAPPPRRRDRSRTRPHTSRTTGRTRCGWRTRNGRMHEWRARARVSRVDTHTSACEGYARAANFRAELPMRACEPRLRGRIAHAPGHARTGVTTAAAAGRRKSPRSPVTYSLTTHQAQPKRRRRPRDRPRGRRGGRPAGYSLRCRSGARSRTRFSTSAAFSRVRHAVSSTRARPYRTGG
jgi:hypothetical protein